MVVRCDDEAAATVVEVGEIVLDLIERCHVVKPEHEAGELKTRCGDPRTVELTDRLTGSR